MQEQQSQAGNRGISTGNADRGSEHSTQPEVDRLWEQRFSELVDNPSERIASAVINAPIEMLREHSGSLLSALYSSESVHTQWRLLSALTHLSPEDLGEYQRAALTDFVSTALQNDTQDLFEPSVRVIATHELHSAVIEIAVAEALPMLSEQGQIQALRWIQALPTVHSRQHVSESLESIIESHNPDDVVYCEALLAACSQFPVETLPMALEFFFQLPDTTVPDEERVVPFAQPDENLRVTGQWCLEFLQPVAEGYFAHLKEIALDETELELRRVNAVFALGILYKGDSRLTEVYNEGLVSSSAAIQRSSLQQIFSLGEDGGPYIGSILPLLYDTDSVVRAKAAHALGGIRLESENIQQELCGAIDRHSEDTEFQKIALWALGLIGNRNIFQRVQAIAEEHTDSEVQLYAQRAGELINSRHPGGLQEGLKNAVRYLSSLHPTLARLEDYL